MRDCVGVGDLLVEFRPGENMDARPAEDENEEGGEAKESLLR